MRQKLITLLKALETAWPPPPKCHHVLMYAQFGSDQTGWEDRLLLQVNNNGVFYPLFLDESDIERPVPSIVSEIVEILKQTPPRNLQVSSVAGQAGPNPISGEAG
jgi:hypothetical protein